MARSKDVPQGSGRSRPPPGSRAAAAAAREILRGEERFRLLVESVKDYAILMLDPAGFVISWNAGAERIKGYCAEEILGQHFSRFYPSEEVQAGKPQRELETAAADGRLEDEGWRVRKDGSRFWANVVITALRDEQGAVVGFGKVTRDFTERRQAEDALHQSEERYRVLFDSNPVPAWVFDLETLQFRAVNDAAVARYGYTRDEFLAMTIADIRPREDIPALRDAVARIALGRTGGGTWRHRKKDGAVIEVEITSHALTFGARPAELVLAHDVTERKRVEDALRAGEEYARLIVEAAYSAFVAIDQEGVITGWNREAEKTFGWSRAEALGRQLTETIIPPRYHDAHRRGLQRFLATGEGPVLNRVIEITALRRSGVEFPVELTIAPLQVGGRHVFAAFVRDITERKRAEAQLQRYAAELEAANAELDAFAHSVSHDLRAPLRSIDGFSRIVLEDSGARLDAAGRDALQRVCAASQRMGFLIDDLLELSRVTRAELRRVPVDLSALARDVARELERSNPQRAVEFAIAPGLVAQGDPRLLRVALENLLGNAWKYTGKHPRARIEFGTTPCEGTLAYHVRDDGAGFDMAYAAKLFGAFQRLHAPTEFEGSGIGLATVQRIIRRHGGRIWAEGAVERGATFYFTLDPEPSRSTADA